MIYPNLKKSVTRSHQAVSVDFFNIIDLFYDVSQSNFGPHLRPMFRPFNATYHTN